MSHFNGIDFCVPNLHRILRKEAMLRSSGIGSRSFGRRTSTDSIRKPRIRSPMPLRVVPTSGNSGIRDLQHPICGILPEFPNIPV